MELDTMTLICVAQHIKSYYRQCVDKEIADWGEPCATCDYFKTCKSDWLARLNPIFTEVNMTISLCRQELSDK